MGLEQIGLAAILDDKNFQEGLKRYTSGIGQMTNLTDGAAKMLSGAFVAATGLAVAGIGAVAAASKIGLDATLAWAENMDKLGDQFGMSGEKASAWTVAMNHVGLSVDEGAAGLNYFTKQLDDFGKATSTGKVTVTPFMTALQKLGIAVRDSKGKLKDFDTIMPEIMDKFSKMPAGVNASAMAMDLFGARGGTKFLDFLRQGGAGLKNATEMAKALGLELSTDEVNAAEEFGFVMNDLNLGLTGVKNTIGRAVLPMAKQLVDWLNRDAIPRLLDLARVYVPLFQQAMRNVSEFIDTKAMPLFMRLWRTLGQPLFEKLIQGLKQFIGWLNTPAVQKGIADLASKIQSGLERLGPIIAQVIAFVGPLIQQFMTDAPAAASSMQASFNQIQQAVMDAWAIAGPILKFFFDTLSQFWTEIQPKLSRAWLAISGAIQVATEMISTFIHDHWTEIKEFLDGAWQAIEGAVTIAWSLISGIIKVALDLIGGDFQAAGVDFRAMLEGAWRGIQMLTAGIWQEIQTVVTNALAGLAGAILAKMGEIRVSIQSGFESALNWLSGLPDRMKQMAINMLAGFIVGMWQEAGAIAQALSDIINQAIDNLKRLLGIASPSKVFAGIGSQMAQGLAQGFSGVLSGFSPVLNANVAAAPFGGMSNLAGITSPRSVSMPAAPRMQMLSSVSRTLNFNIGSVNGVADFDYRVRQIVQAHDRGH